MVRNLSPIDAGSPRCLVGLIFVGQRRSDGGPLLVYKPDAVRRKLPSGAGKLQFRSRRTVVLRCLATVYIIQGRSTYDKHQALRGQLEACSTDFRLWASKRPRCCGVCSFGRYRHMTAHGPYGPSTVILRPRGGSSAESDRTPLPLYNQRE